MLVMCCGFGVLIVQPEEVSPEIVLHVPPHGMDVVGVILRIVVLREEERSVKAIVVRFAAFLGARPRKMDIVQIGVS